MREIKFIAVHCTATTQTTTVESIKRYWREDLKWKNPGYHYLIKPGGEIIELFPESKVSNGVAGYNSYTVNVCYIGGVNAQGRPVDNRTIAQKEAMSFLLKELKKRYPQAVIQGHRDFPGVKKACPCFNAKQEYKNL